MADVDPAIAAAFDALVACRTVANLERVALAVVAAARPIVERECYTRAAEAILEDQRRRLQAGTASPVSQALEVVRGLAGLHGQENG